jgi:N-acetylglucosaminyl-diphospho-decaprenol L-rhamnosyltransferase
MTLAIVIVTYNSAEEMAGCLAACPREASTCVVDNASTDGSARFATIVNPENRGFAAAVNQGFAATSEPLVLVLNPDCRIQGGLEAMTALFDDPTVGAAGGLLVDESGLAQTGFAVRRFPTVANQVAELAGLNRLWPNNPLNRGYRCLDLDLSQEQDVEQPAGAFLLVRRAAWEQVGGFDENFHPVWFEDVDFCYRLRQEGWRIRYSPLARATHIGGHSVNKLSWECKQIYWYGSLLRYANKHWGGRGERRVALALLLVAIPRGVIGMLNRFTLEPLLVAGKLASRALGVLRTPRQGERSGRTS